MRSQQSSPIFAKITGTGFCVPPKVVTNADLEKLMDTTDEWIKQRSGIEERRFTEPGVKPSELAYEASIKALQNANLKADNLDLIIVSTLSSEHYFPGTSAFLQHRFGLTTTPCFDLRAQCSGFIYGLNVAKAFVASGQYKKILLVGCEVQSGAFEYSTKYRDMAVLFGDGAGAVVVEASDNPRNGFIGDVVLHAQGEFGNKLWCEYPSASEKPFVTTKAIEEGLVHPSMDGRFVFKHAVTRLPQVVREVLDANKMTVGDIDLFLFHQANLRINEVVAKELEIPVEKMHNNIQKYGNTSAASIPILLDECVREGKLKPGMTVCLAAFGAGFTWASALIKW